jgi:ribose transport system permease protein
VPSSKTLLTARPTRAIIASAKTASAVWVFAVIFLVFALWIPDTFLTSGTWRSLLDQQAVTALIAIGLVIPLAAGAFDLAIGTEVGLGAIFVAWLLMKSVPIVPAVLLSVIAGAVVGLGSGWLVVRARIDSFIATLGVSSILLAVISWISGDQQIIGLSNSFANIANRQMLGVTLPVYFMLLVASLVYYVLEHTALGRRIYATGGNETAARLAGVRTSRIIVGALVVSGVIASFSGVLVSSSLATGDPTIGPPYLLPAFSACFLGSTQFREGRFNVWGTVVAVYVLATGVKGLQLAGAPTWIPDLFNGVALLIAVGLAKHQRTARRAGAVGRMLSKTRARTAAPTDLLESPSAAASANGTATAGFAATGTAEGSGNALGADRGSGDG